MVPQPDPSLRSTAEHSAHLVSRWSAGARRDFAVGVVVACGYLALAVTDRVQNVLPVLAFFDGPGRFADEFLLGAILASVLGVVWAVRRGTELRGTLRALAQAQRLAELSFDDNPLPMVVLDTSTLRFLAVNDAAVRQYGWSREEFLETLHGPDLSPPEARSAALARGKQLASACGVSTAVRHIRKDGSLLWTDITFAPVRFLGAPASLGVAIDVTDREQMAAQHRVAEARFRAVFDTDAAGIVEVSGPGLIVAANACFARMVGRTPEELAGVSVASITHPDDVRESANLLRSLDDGRSPTYSIVKRYIRPDGSVVWALVAVSHVAGDGTVPARNIAVAIDMTSLRRAEEERELLHERLDLAMDATGEGLWDWNLQTDDCFYSPALNRMLGYGADELPNHIGTWKLRIHPEDAAKVASILQEHLAGNTASYDAEHRLLRKDGSFLWVLDRGRVVRRDAAGQPSRMVGTLTDISARRDLEDQLRQAQKMEAIGQLAGGVAHDFNNLLTVIRTGLELALAENLSAETRADLSEVEMATERAATLTSQLLAFSRRRLAQARNMSLNDAVDELARLLTRVLTEDIEVRRRLETRGRVMADPGHVGQALLNIAVNARDAMPDGGVLTLATFDTTVAEHSLEAHDGVSPGRYSVVTIGDTGTGMSAEVRTHIFEPFFTTKALGKGTGLGLASVYGIVKQVDGAVRVESAPGVGTKFLLYFPVADADHVAVEPVRGADLPGGKELVLVAEDDPAVRNVAMRVLAMHGYRVREAANGAQGVAMLEAEPGIACIVADVVMPVMSGSALAGVTHDRFPQMGIVVMSAHSHDVVSQFPLPPGTAILQKPFTTASLLKAVRSAIDAKRQSG